MDSRLLITIAIFLLATICYFPHPGHGYNVFPNNITVSGLSAGGFMAVQFTVAFSSVIKGLGVFAGGPYYCAQGSETTAEIDCTQLYQNVNVQTLVSDAQKFAQDGDIDDLSNLDGLPLYLYSGEFDTVVNPAIVKMVPVFFQSVATGINVSSEYSIPSEHCLPTLDYGSECILLGSPYINKCNYDGAGQALQAIYGTLSPSVSFDATNIIQFDQQQFIPQGDTSAGLAQNAYVYVPTACRNNATCTLHVVFHGCNQSYLKIGNDYYQNGGYNGWAEANNIIVLYPQADSSFISNPEGCFDWWGYTNSNYAFKTSSQMATFMNMINYISSNKANF